MENLKLPNCQNYGLQRLGKNWAFASVLVIDPLAIMSGVAAAVTQTKTPRGGGSTAQESKRQPSAKHLGEISILTNHKHLRRRDTKFNKEEFEEECIVAASNVSIPDGPISPRL